MITKLQLKCFCKNINYISKSYFTNCTHMNKYCTEDDSIKNTREIRKEGNSKVVKVSEKGHLSKMAALLTRLTQFNMAAAFSRSL